MKRVKDLIFKIRSNRKTYNDAYGWFLLGIVTATAVVMFFTAFQSLLALVGVLLIGLALMLLFVAFFFRPQMWSQKDRDEEGL